MEPRLKDIQLETRSAAECSASGVNGAAERQGREEESVLPVVGNPRNATDRGEALCDGGDDVRLCQ